MMPEAAAWPARARGAMRSAAAFVAAAAIFLQLILAAPLEMRMLLGADVAAWPFALCAMRSAGGTSDPAPASPPASPHDHYNCPVCQSHAVPLGILAGGTRIFVASTSWRPWLQNDVPAPAPTRPFRLYGSRAPPAQA